MKKIIIFISIFIAVIVLKPSGIYASDLKIDDFSDIQIQAYSHNKNITKEFKHALLEKGEDQAIQDLMDKYDTFTAEMKILKEDETSNNIKTYVAKNIEIKTYKAFRWIERVYGQYSVNVDKQVITSARNPYVTIESDNGIGLSSSMLSRYYKINSSKTGVSFVVNYDLMTVNSIATGYGYIGKFQGVAQGGVLSVK